MGFGGKFGECLVGIHLSILEVGVQNDLKVLSDRREQRKEKTQKIETETETEVFLAIPMEKET